MHVPEPTLRGLHCRAAPYVGGRVAGRQTAKADDRQFHLVGAGGESVAGEPELLPRGTELELRATQVDT